MSNTFVICVCGGRDYANHEYLYKKLDAAYEHFTQRKKMLAIMSGCAPGADTLALEWAYSRNVATREYPANWKRDKRAAGPIRNRQMLKAGFDVLFAFPGGPGTRDMINISETAGKTVVRFKK